jgi:hypothetical protein
MIIECNYCKATVDAKVLAEHEIVPEDGPFKTSFLECPLCKDVLLAGQEYIQVSEEDWEWSQAVRLWPEPKKYYDWSIPNLVRDSLEEAQKCYKGKAFDACAVMCGRVLEAICVEYKTKDKSLQGRLKELLDQHVIDKRIFDWADALRLSRNTGAHATSEKISKEDALNLLEFSSAICDYVFVLNKKFEEFLKRRDKKKTKESSDATV